tara:strand:- start:621 stop:797 length:177 start_codon:yes stop_codon:yes gene_type:complete
MYIYIFDLMGTFAFAISGAIATTNKKLDVFGVTFAAFVTAIGVVQFEICFLENFLLVG